MSPLRSAGIVAGAAACGGIGAFAVGSLAGMPGDDLSQLVVMLMAASAVTTAVTVALARALTATALRHRMIALSVVAVAIAAANVAALSRLMFVSSHDALLLGSLLVFAAGTGVGVALSLAASTKRSLGRITDTVEALESGDLSARTGDIAGDPELAAIARALDEMAASLKRSLERERELESRRMDLITAVSHDLRTPLANVRAMIEAIDDAVVTDVPTIQRYAREMKAAVGSLVELVDDLFELVKLDAVAIESEARRMRMEDAVGAAVAACGPHAAAKDLKVTADLSGVEDALCSPPMVRVLQNLLTNAIRHTPADGSVTIDASLHEGGLSVEVADTGEGIAEVDLQRVFEPFWRGDPARSTGGSGLGLALAQRIVESMDGTIEARSEVGAGSRFRVWIPRVEWDSGRADREPDPTRPEIGRTSRGWRREFP